VLPETAEQQADSALVRVLGAMHELSVQVDDREYVLTAAAGVSIFPDDGKTVEELVAKAATTMFTARTTGKGKFAFYSTPAST
jgi:GGDEF domain-containing protein